MTTALYLIGGIAGQTVAFAADDIDSVIDLGEITPVPRAARGVVGLTALRSRVVTVIDPRSGLGCEAGSVTGGRAVVARIDGHTYAIKVDALEDVAGFDLSPLPPGFALEGVWATAAIGLIERDGEPALAISPAALIPGPCTAAA